MLDEFILRALLAANLLALMMGPLGALVVWRQMAYFGDTIAHAALLGVAISLLSSGLVPMTAAIIAVALVIALVLARYARDARFQADTLLGMLAHGALALSVVLIALKRDVRVDMNAYLFGDILAIDNTDLMVLAALGLLISLLLRWCWRALLMVAIDPAIAAVEGVNVPRVHLLLTFMLALVVAVAIKLSGALLLTALLIIPAASARYLAHSPRQMAMLASLLGMVSVSGGLVSSLVLDVPSGPMMVLAAVILFCALALVNQRR